MVSQCSISCLSRNGDFIWKNDNVIRITKNNYMVSLDENRNDMGGGLK